MSDCSQALPKFQPALSSWLLLLPPLQLVASQELLCAKRADLPRFEDLLNMLGGESS
jgi:hypothetical protein